MVNSCLCAFHYPVMCLLGLVHLSQASLCSLHHLSFFYQHICCGNMSCLVILHWTFVQETRNHAGETATCRICWSRSCHHALAHQQRGNSANSLSGKCGCNRWLYLSSINSKCRVIWINSHQTSTRRLFSLNAGVHIGLNQEGRMLSSSQPWLSGSHWSTTLSRSHKSTKTRRQNVIKWFMTEASGVLCNLQDRQHSQRPLRLRSALWIANIRPWVCSLYFG